MSYQGIKYTVDIVLCIDATGSMSGIINKVKENALLFHQDLEKTMSEKGKNIDRLRIKVILFRDYYVDGADSMKESDFIVLPEQNENFRAFINSCNASGGGDEPESGLESLALAIKSTWTKEGDRKRQIIVVWTDASAHKLEKHGKPSHYPSSMPANFDELTDLWENSEHISLSAKRLLIYAPDAYPWTDIITNWNNTIGFTSKAGEGLSDHDYKTIINQVANSV